MIPHFDGFPDSFRSRSFALNTRDEWWIHTFTKADLYKWACSRAPSVVWTFMKEHQLCSKPRGNNSGINPSSSSWQEINTAQVSYVNQPILTGTSGARWQELGSDCGVNDAPTIGASVHFLIFTFIMRGNGAAASCCQREIWQDGSASPYYPVSILLSSKSGS